MTATQWGRWVSAPTVPSDCDGAGRRRVTVERLFEARPRGIGTIPDRSAPAWAATWTLGGKPDPGGVWGLGLAGWLGATSPVLGARRHAGSVA